MPSAPAAPSAATKAETAAKEASSVLSDKNRKHLYEGEIHPKRGNSTGWNYEPTGHREKGTYVIEGTRSPPDEHGVYEANVMIEGVKKKSRSLFFPDDWTTEQVDSAVREAYRDKKRYKETERLRGDSASGLEIEMTLDQDGAVDRIYPVYKGPKYEGPKK